MDLMEKKMVYILFGILLITQCHPNYIVEEKGLETVTEHTNSTVDPKELGEAIRNLKLFPTVQVCDECKYGVDGILQYVRSAVQKDIIINLIVDLCVVCTDDDEWGCREEVENEIDTILYIIDNRKNLTAARVCSICFQSNSCKDPDVSDWHVDLPEPPTQNQVQPASDENNTESRTVKLLHLTDIHFDPLYVPGSDSVCESIVCCRGGAPFNPEDAAGYWGDYHVCDMPWHSVVDLMNQVKKQHPEIDYVYHTGDVIDHGVWSTSASYISSNIRRISDIYLKTFNTTPVYPVLGNHDVHPCDYFAPDNVTAKFSTQWLFDLIAEDWSKWLPAHTKKTLEHGGYYTVLVKKGFRIIGLNSNLWYQFNVWSLYELDPYGQLQWLANTLAEAEKNNEVVHILSHIPAGSVELWYKHSDEFNRIIRRFAAIIKAHFNGHSHFSEIRLYLNENKTNAINVAYNGGSFTTFVGMNPNYRVYDMDGKTFEITDYDEWMYNLTEANFHNNTPPKWYKLYSFKEAYGLNSTSMEDLFDWIQRMRGDPQGYLMNQYFRYLFRESEVKLGTECRTSACLDAQLCYLTSVDFDDAIKCNPPIYFPHFNYSGFDYFDHAHTYAAIKSNSPSYTYDAIKSNSPTHYSYINPRIVHILYLFVFV